MRFEWVKWKRNPKNILVLGLLLVSIGVLLAEQWDHNKQADKRDYKVLKTMADEIQPPQGYIGAPDPYKMLHHLDEQGAFLSEKDQKQYEKVVNILYLLEDENTARSKGDWQVHRAVQTERLLLQKEYIVAGGTEWSMLSLEKAKQQLSRNDWLGHYELPIEEVSSSPKGIYFIYTLLRQSMTYGVLILLVALFFFDFLTNEYEQKTYLFLSVQPISKWQKYRRKASTAIWITGTIYLLYLGISFLAASLLFGMGSANYPIIIEETDNFSYISIGTYIITVVALQLLFMIFLVQVILLLSMVLKNALEVLAVFLLILLLPNLLQNAISAISDIGQWLPFCYMNVDSYLTTSNGFIKGSIVGVIVLFLGNFSLLKVSRWVVKLS